MKWRSPARSSLAVGVAICWIAVAAGLAALAHPRKSSGERRDAATEPRGETRR